jgi:protein-S-isoprenylcysteine O-methyltransferase Ste14
MAHVDTALILAHITFCAVFGAGLLLRRRRTDADTATTTDQSIGAAPRSRLYVAVHGVAFWLMYFGIGQAFARTDAHAIPLVCRVEGATLILLGAAIAASAVSVFSSWRFRAQVDRGHTLVTSGPFRITRHPIYLGLDLLALGTAVWLQGPYLWSAFVIMCIGSDLRARAEERLLTRAFGATYTAYMSRTRRFIPGVY